MQDCYVGDAGDFGKYGLLRALCSPNEADAGPALSLGVAWYLIPDESHNDDGRHVRYLDVERSEPSSRNRNQFRECDPPLYDALRNVLRAGARKVESIRQSSILPSGTEYYENPLTFKGITSTGRNLQKLRAARRRGWLQGALDLTSGCDVVFVDPDNGLEVKSISRTAKKGPKYAFFNELSPYLQRDQSLVIYQHISRSGKAEDQIRRRLAEIEECLGRPAIGLWYRRGTSRVFFIVPAQQHREIMHSRVERFRKSPWKRHFKLIKPA